MFHSPCVFTPSSAPAALAQRHSTVSENQFPSQRVSRTNAPPPAHRPQAFQPTLSDLPSFGQQDRELTFFELLTIDPSLQSEPVDDLPPATDPEPGVCLCVLSNTTSRPLCESMYWCAIVVDLCMHYIRMTGYVCIPVCRYRCSMELGVGVHTTYRHRLLYVSCTGVTFSTFPACVTLTLSPSSCRSDSYSRSMP